LDVHSPIFHNFPDFSAGIFAVWDIGISDDIAPNAAASWGGNSSLRHFFSVFRFVGFTAFTQSDTLRRLSRTSGIPGI